MKNLLPEKSNTYEQIEAYLAERAGAFCELPIEEPKGPRDSTINNILNFSRSYEPMQESKYLHDDHQGFIRN
jgi:hypothetical protein